MAISNLRSHQINLLEHFFPKMYIFCIFLLIQFTLTPLIRIAYHVIRFFGQVILLSQTYQKIKLCHIDYILFFFPAFFRACPNSYANLCAKVKLIFHEDDFHRTTFLQIFTDMISRKTKNGKLRVHAFWGYLLKNKP